jgi:acetyl esterase/lipase
MFKLWPDKDITVKKAKAGRVPLLILSPKGGAKNAPGVLWIHGGGYVLGMKEMVYMGRAEDLVKKFGAVVISPGYRLAFQKPYPAAINDCCGEVQREVSIRDEELFQRTKYIKGVYYESFGS